jgi:hypothetical protein
MSGNSRERGTCDIGWPVAHPRLSIIHFFYTGFPQITLCAATITIPNRAIAIGATAGMETRQPEQRILLMRCRWNGENSSMTIGIPWFQKRLEMAVENWDETGAPPVVAGASVSIGAVFHVLVPKNFAQIDSVNRAL